MPADDSLSQEPTAKTHSNGDAPYPCSQAKQAPRSTWAVDYGYCRHSLDQLAGRDDKRCPASCQHKAPRNVSDRFLEIYFAEGNEKAAAYSRGDRENGQEKRSL